MKRLLTTGLIVVSLLFALNTAAMAQTGDFKLGGGIVLSTGALENSNLDNTFGIKVDGIYRLDENWRAGGDFTFYFPDSEGDVDATVWELNFNGNYIFHEEEELMGYAIGGLNITSVSIDTPVGESSESEFGLNLGAGLEYSLDFADLFGEAKFGGIGSDADQFVFGAGFRFDL